MTRPANSKHKTWAEVRAGGVRRHPGVEADAAVERERAIKEIADYEATMVELRRARQLTQVTLAETLGTSQGEVSRIERQTDLYLSTLSRYIEAMGGELELVARFDDGERVAVKLPDLARRKPAA
ncbi:MAG TPA: XRE family transcriptional regulator [Conexibacter sp.]|jgi:ribosome-binding protein aMBF1 (putative translation factor)